MLLTRIKKLMYSIIFCLCDDYINIRLDIFVLHDWSTDIQHNMVKVNGEYILRYFLTYHSFYFLDIVSRWSMCCQKLLRTPTLPLYIVDKFFIYRYIWKSIKHLLSLFKPTCPFIAIILLAGKGRLFVTYSGIYH